MSWIKKIFTMFQNDDDDNLVDIEHVQSVQKPLHTERNGKKDVEARVLYQYPKGQFRFPLIPDEHSGTVKVNKKHVTSENVEPVAEIKPLFKEKGPLKVKEKGEPLKAASAKPRKETVKEKPQSFKRDTVKETASKFRYEPRKESSAKFRQPFKPTEIPSPIYAYNRPPIKPKQENKKGLDEVEYELRGFEHNQVTSGGDAGISEEYVSSMAEVNRTEGFLENPSQNETVSADESEKQDIYIMEDPAEAPDEKNYQQAADTETETETEIETVTSAEQSQLEEEALNKIFEVGLSQKVPVITEELAVNQQEFDEENNSALVKEEAVKQTVEQTAAEITNYPDQRVEQPEPPEQREQQEQQGQPEQPEQPRTRQLPFNVIMLKQDRKKWEERKSSKYPSFMAERSKISATSEPDQQANGTIAKDYNEEKNGQTTANSEILTLEQTAPSEANRQPIVIEQEPLLQPDRQQAISEKSVSQEGILDEFEQTAPKQEFVNQPAPIQQEAVILNSQADPVKTAPSVPVTNEVAAAVQTEAEAPGDYEFPPLDLLSPPVFKEPDPEWLAEQEHMLNETLRNFNVGARVVNMTQGPSVTRFEVQPEPGVKVNKITNLSDDIKLSLAAKDIRIEAPIPGKHTIGIEVPNHSSRPVLLSEILQGGSFLEHESPLAVALGLDIAGNPIITDLKKMPHGLIAGATGSGKSVCINTMLVSLLYKAHPDDVKLLLIDPKMVELAPYNNIPHLVSPVITDVKAATASLKWAVEEMERRYELFAHTGVRDINRFNELAIKHRRFSEKLPFIVIVIDELADLMMMAPADVEEAICRIAQKARACGIHLIIATQRPSVDVITGLIKANVPTRIAFSVSSQIDSRTIIDISGAEKLLGRGDMLFLENGSSKPFRLQGTYVTDNEIDDIVAFAREQRAPQFLFEQEELLKKAQVIEEEDGLFYEACEFVVEQGGASTSSVQRRFKIGYNRAARLIEMMEHQGFISEGRGSKPRDVLISAADLESLQDTSTFN
ncbi:DNA translocase FtsK [Heyndrickxia sp. MSNUG]|uniref:DNA translocase FtsK n=1 Tax=Heyndrickxia sp. MSNUG TaxID=3136677 RepID=UPI003C2ABEBC